MTEWDDFIKAVEYGKEIQSRLDMESAPRATFLLIGIILGFVLGFVVYAL